MAWRFPFPEWFLIALLPHDAVLCGYCEENGSLPFCVWVTVEDIVPSYCWTTCRCFQFWEPDQQWFFVYTPPACRGNMRSHVRTYPFCTPTWFPICNFDQYYLCFFKIVKAAISWKYFFYDKSNVTQIVLSKLLVKVGEVCSYVCEWSYCTWNSVLSAMITVSMGNKFIINGIYFLLFDVIMCYLKQPFM